MEGDITNQELTDIYVSTRKENKKNVKFHQILCEKYPKYQDVPIDVIVKKVECIKIIKSKFLKNGEKEKAKSFMEAKCDIGHTRDVEKSRKSFDQTLTETVNSKLLQENIELSKQNSTLQIKLSLKDGVKCIKPKVHNQFKKRKERHIKIQTNVIKRQKLDIQSLQKSVAKKEKVSRVNLSKLAQVRRSKTLLSQKIAQMRKENCRLRKKIEIQTLENKSLKESVKILEIENHSLNDACKTIANLTEEKKKLLKEIEYLELELDSLEETRIETQNGSVFTDDIRCACYYLLQRGVGLKHVGPCIKFIIENVAGLEIGILPSESEVALMQREAGVIAKIQIGEALSSEDDTTAHCDGTTKRGKHYATYQITTKNLQTFDIGVKQMKSGTTVCYMDIFQSLLEEISTVYAKVNSSHSNVGNEILGRVKNIIGDRHIVQKKLAECIQEYRKNVLPDVVENWGELCDTDQDRMAVLNNFSCGLHLLVSFATTAEKTVKEWEKSNIPSHSANRGLRGESGTVLFIKAFSNAFHKDGGGHPAELAAFAYDKNKEVTIVPFKGNRFNIVFHNAGAVHYLSDVMEEFLTKIHKTHNRLDSAIHSDMSQRPQYLIACRALGLIGKVITTPLWNVLEEKQMSILDMNKYYEILVEKLALWSKDAADIINGKASLFDDIPVNKDVVYDHLTCGNEELLNGLLQSICGELLVLSNRLLSDHLPGGKFANPSQKLCEETKSCPPHNKASETHFGKFDRFLKHAPNSNVRYLESKILCEKNSTVQGYLMEKTPRERSNIIKIARSTARELFKKESKEKKVILQAKIEKLKQQEQELLKKQQRIAENKEKILTEISKFGGLWVTKEQMDMNLEKISQARRIAALHLQINCRRKVLQQQDIILCLWTETFGRDSRQRPNLLVACEQHWDSLCLWTETFGQISSQKPDLLITCKQHWNLPAQVW